MSPYLRIGISLSLLILGFSMLTFGFWHRHELWVGLRTKEVPIPIVNNIPVSTEQQKLDNGQLDTGNLEIEAKYETKDNHLPSGDYQVRDINNKIWMLKLCPAENNGVLPDFKIGRVVNIVYTKGLNCYNFLSATLIKEEGK